MRFRSFSRKRNEYFSYSYRYSYTFCRTLLWLTGKSARLMPTYGLCLLCSRSERASYFSVVYFDEISTSVARLQVRIKIRRRAAAAAGNEWMLLASAD